VAVVVATSSANWCAANAISRSRTSAKNLRGPHGLVDLLADPAEALVDRRAASPLKGSSAPSSVMPLQPTGGGHQELERVGLGSSGVTVLRSFGSCAPRARRRSSRCLSRKVSESAPSTPDLGRQRLAGLRVHQLQLVALSAPLGRIERGQVETFVGHGMHPPVGADVWTAGQPAGEMGVPVPQGGHAVNWILIVVTAISASMPAQRVSVYHAGVR
jgi:hypothetical protein